MSEAVQLTSLVVKDESSHTTMDVPPMKTESNPTNFLTPPKPPNHLPSLNGGGHINKGFQDVDLTDEVKGQPIPTDSNARQRIKASLSSSKIEPAAVEEGAAEQYEKATDEQLSGCLGYIHKGQVVGQEVIALHGQKIKMALGALLLLGYGVYFGYAMWWSLEGEDQIRLLWITLLAAVLCIISVIKRTCGSTIESKLIRPIVTFVLRYSTIFKWCLGLAFAIFVIVFIIVAIAINRPRNLVSLSGHVVYILLLFLLSNNPARVKWRPVVCGLGIQFVLALIVLKTSWGLQAFQWLGTRMTEFLQHTDAGSKFVFGDSYEDHRFAFKVLPVVVYFSAVISTLYYLGIMQTVIMKLAWVMIRTLGTTAGESVNAAGNIFVGQTEAPLLIRPLIDSMTPSELHAVMTGGYATIAGSVMASFILFGVKANHLISASVMAAPCALALSKLSYPETSKSTSTSTDVKTMEKQPVRNVIEAVAAGASAAISLAANIAANLIAFMALLAFVNATLQWFGARVGLGPPDYPPLTFQVVCSYLLWPFAFLMGVDVGDCRKVAELIGFKTFINEFVAFTELGKLIDNRKVLDNYQGAWVWENQDIILKDTGTRLIGGVITQRSEVISTYALCGFANFSSIGMVMGALGSMSEKQKPVIARLALRAMLVGNIVCFVNACTAGLLYEGS